jgi:nicotinate-nucleotide adenylyltransferase
VAIRAIFGGSFDPPHVGHVLAVTYVLMTEMVEQVTVVPVFRHAFDKDMADYEHRLALARAAFGHLAEVDVSDVERSLPTPSYTIRTLEALADRYPRDEFRLLIGADLLADAARWVRFDEVCQRAPLLVLGRVGVEAEGAPSVLPEVSSSRVRGWLRLRSEAEAMRQLRWALPARVLREIELRRLYL